MARFACRGRLAGDHFGVGHAGRCRTLGCGPDRHTVDRRVPCDVAGSHDSRRAGERFELAPQPAGPGPGWQVALVAEKSAETAVRVIANLRIEQNQLRFQRDAAAPEIEGAAQLSNCVLRLTSGTQTHDLRLRKPLHAEPLQIDLRKTSAVAREGCSATRS